MMTPGGFHSFEHRWALGEAFEFHRAIGKAKVAARIHELNRQCKEGLAAMKHVTLHTPLSDECSAGIITFEVAGMKPGRRGQAPAREAHRREHDALRSELRAPRAGVAQSPQSRSRPCCRRSARSG